MIVAAIGAFAMLATLQGPVASPPSGSGPVLTLDSCLRIAEHNATAIRVAAAGVQLSGAEVLRRHGAFLPSADLGAGFLRQDGNTFLSQTATVPTSAAFSVIGYRLSTSLNLFNGFRDQAGLAAALKGEEAATWNLARARQQVAYDVTQAYLQAILDGRLVEIALQNVTLSQARQSQLEELVRVGRRPPTDLFRQEAQTSADEAAVVDARDREQVDLIALLARLRLAPDSDYRLAPITPDTSRMAIDTSNVAALVTRARTDRPDLRSVSASLQEASELLRRARGGELPTVDLGVDGFGTGRVFDREIQNGTDLLPATQRDLVGQIFPQSAYAVSLTVTWHLFDRYATRLDIERARIAQDLSGLQYDDLRLRIAGEVKSAVADYSAAINRLDVARRGLVAADTAFAAIQARYDAGLSDFVDVITTQTQLTQSREASAAAIIRFALSKRVLELALGADPSPH